MNKMNFVNYPDIEQYRNIVREIKYLANKYTNPLPKLKVMASEKIHGTNMAFCINENEYWFQSRNSILTSDPELMYKEGFINIDKFSGFGMFLKNKLDVFKNITSKLAEEYNIDLSKKTLALFFEFAGGSIQRNSACTGLDRRCFIFQHFMTKEIDAVADENGYIESSKWLETKADGKFISADDYNIFNIMNFNIWKFDVDFSNPLVSQNEFIDVVDVLEQESPVGKSFGIEGNVGEGIVCTFTYMDRLFKFKVKGEKHAKGSGKVKTLTPVDIEKINKVKEFSQTIIHDWRFEQGLHEIFGENYIENLDRTKIGKYIKWVNIDTIKEEKDLIDESDFTTKDVMPIVAQKAKEYFFMIEKECDKL